MKDYETKVILNGVPVTLDKRFVNIILLLNAKGYITSDCCSGHTLNEVKMEPNTESFAYIGFDEDYLPPTFPSNIHSVNRYGSKGKHEKVGIDWRVGPNPTDEELDILASSIFNWVIGLPYNERYLYEKSL
jgi:hypothetical protein